MNNKFKQFDSIVNEMKKIHHAKNHDYSGKDYLSNLIACERTGLPAWKGTVVRLQDKMSRLENFTKKGKLKVKDESVEDTLKDMAVYSILCLILYRNEKK